MEYTDILDFKHQIGSFLIKHYPIQVIVHLKVEKPLVITEEVNSSDSKIELVLSALHSHFTDYTFEYIESDNIFHIANLSGKYELIKSGRDLQKCFMPGLSIKNEPVNPTSLSKTFDIVRRLFHVGELAVLPCYFKGELLDFMVIGHNKKFSDEDIDILNLFCYQIAARSLIERHPDHELYNDVNLKMLDNQLNKLINNKLDQ